MDARIPLALLVAVSLVAAPVAAQSSGVRVRIIPQFDEVALGAGQRGNVPMDVRLDVGTTCTSGTEFGVTLVFADSFPSWAGASPEPASLSFDERGGTKKSTLGIFPGEDAPPGQTVNYRLRPEVRVNAPANCAGNITVDAADALVKLTILTPEQTGGPEDDDGGGSSPGLGAASLLLAFSGLVLLRRRR